MSVWVSVQQCVCVHLGFAFQMQNEEIDALLIVSKCRSKLLWQGTSFRVLWRLPSRTGSRRMRRRYVRMWKKLISVFSRKISQKKKKKRERNKNNVNLIRQWSHWRTFWKRHASWEPRISFNTSKNPVCRKNGPAKEYVPLFFIIIFQFAFRVHQQSIISL